MKRRRRLFWAAFAAVLVLAVLLGFRDVTEAAMSEGGSHVVLALGRTMGTLLIALLLLQPVLAMRLSALERVFGLDRLLAFHRLSAVFCLTAGFLHPMLVYGSKLRSAGPSGWHLWPVGLGALALIGLWALVVSSIYRDFLLLRWEAWRKLHVILALLIVPALAHTVAVQPDFRGSLPLVLWIVLLGSWLGVILWHRYANAGLKRSRWQFDVVSAIPVARGVTEVTLTPNDAHLSYAPGQFAFLRFRSNHVAPEEHPFTISATPQGTRDIQFTIKESGDFTRTVKSLGPGDTAEVSGPYGIFTPARFGELKHLVLIAGGIGITPMLSVLRSASLTAQRAAMTLLWSNRTTEDTPYLDELASMGDTMPELSIHHFLTQDTRPGARTGRLDATALRELAPSYEPGVHVMLCGPRKMMRSLARELRCLGYPRSTIHYEDFAL